VQARTTPPLVAALADHPVRALYRRPNLPTLAESQSSSPISDDVTGTRSTHAVAMTKIQLTNVSRNAADRFVLTGLALLLTGLALSACGSSSSSKPTYCDNINSLKQSVKAVSNVNLVENGTSALTSALTQVKDDFAAVEQSTAEQFASQTSQLKSSVDQFTSTAQNVKSSPSTAGVAQLKTDAQAVGAATRDLVAAAECG
jgi:methyl-accepting chemotaxis protein